MATFSHLDRDRAIEQAQEWFEEHSSLAPHMPFAAVDKSAIVEAPFGWILPWNDCRYLQGDIRYELQGHSPVVILKRGGSAMWLPKLTAAECTKWKSKQLYGSIEHRIANLAQKLGIK